MEEPSVKAGDFDAKPRRASWELKEYFQHGVPFVGLMTIIILIAQPIISILSIFTDLIVLSVMEAPNLATSPFASSIMLVILVVFAIVGLSYFAGALNRILAERIWKINQNTLWDRQVGLGITLIGTLLIVHFPLFPFYILWMSGLILEQLVFLIFYIPIVSVIDGVIAKFLASFRPD